MADKPSIYIVAGEPSGDMHAARVLRQLKEMVPGLAARGIGGQALAAEGMGLQRHTGEMAVMGLAEVLRRYGFFRTVFAETVQDIVANPPDLLLLVDYPGFNLRLAKAVRHLRIPTVQYVCPQVWAWKKGRIRDMERYLDRVQCIFPFEPTFLRHTELNTGYVGHPIVDETSEVEAADWPADGKRLLLLPGSREQEVARILAPMLETADLLAARSPNLSIRIAVANETIGQQIEAGLGGRSYDLVEGQTRALLRSADAAMVTSGTATLETALLGCPMIVVYRTSPLTYAIGKRIVKLPNIGMVNLVAGREVCPEFIQGEMIPARMAQALEPLLHETDTRETMLQDLAMVREKLSSDFEAKIPAEEIVELGKFSANTPSTD